LELDVFPITDFNWIYQDFAKVMKDFAANIRSESEFFVICSYTADIQETSLLQVRSAFCPEMRFRYSWRL